MLKGEFNRGDLVVSVAGHDRGDLLIVLGPESEPSREKAPRYLVADGRRRSVARGKLKKKNGLHLRMTEPGFAPCLPTDLPPPLTQEAYNLDAYLRCLIKDYTAGQNGKKY
ncbi:MAG: hypothetical protein GX900_03495 [Clostridiaceae bacterium]|nr:hypothetical protein [Clostridiaceae bacterium]